MWYWLFVFILFLFLIYTLAAFYYIIDPKRPRRNRNRLR